MSRIKIKNFGPIKEGLLENDGWMDIRKVTMFIGNQGSGKSTVVKLISTLMWMEKSILNGNLTDERTENDFINKHCNYFKLKKYFKEDTEIQFDGEYYSISYIDKKIRYDFKNHDDLYFIPKIMYVPAERSFLSSVERADNFSGLPLPLVTFQVEYERSLEELNDTLQLPLVGYQLKYDSFKKTAYVIGQGYELELDAASSGLQSSIPLYVVSMNLSQIIASGKTDTSVSTLNSKQFKKRTAELKAVGLLGNNNYDNGEAQKLAERNEEIINSMFKNSVFINIVEEPEQNLFPTSQYQILCSLIEFNNMNRGNKLIMTTHSPYLINDLTLAIEANSLVQKIKDAGKEDSLNEKVYQIVPKDSTVSGEDVAIYEMDETTGTVSLLGNYKGLPSDENKLNEELGDGNELFANLLEIEQQI